MIGGKRSGKGAARQGAGAHPEKVDDAFKGAQSLDVWKIEGVVALRLLRRAIDVDIAMCLSVKEKDTWVLLIASCLSLYMTCEKQLFWTSQHK